MNVTISLAKPTKKRQVIGKTTACENHAPRMKKNDDITTKGMAHFFSCA